MGDGSGILDQKGKGRAAQNGDVLALDLDSAEEGGSRGNGFMQMQLVEQQVRSLFELSPRTIWCTDTARTIYRTAISSRALLP